ncbi:uncharacterized protein LOC122405250 [Colletes gigas]|uniref:uncharacterized protein LOC122405250 n=1 Tax=Colletes gigas TaxID=935657 RepID=UPI001C9B2DDE|nr:uncharacterized protein LOC122405250 [Colletes gigas]
MFPLRQIFRLGTRLTLTREPSNLHQFSLIAQKEFNNGQEKMFVRTKTNLCESPQEDKKELVEKQVLGKVVAKLKLMFTCKRCNFRNSKTISKVAYEKGVVIIRCDGCKNNHLIADNLGWFAEMQKVRNIEKLLAAKGETVRKIQNDVDGYLEVVAKEEFYTLQHNMNRERLIEEQKNEISISNKKPETSEDT